MQILRGRRRTGSLEFEKKCESPARRARPCLDSSAGVTHPVMIKVFDIDDRARLAERFFGATHSVQARL
jgi:hypothetical protein